MLLSSCMYWSVIQNRRQRRGRGSSGPDILADILADILVNSGSSSIDRVTASMYTYPRRNQE